MSDPLLLSVRDAAAELGLGRDLTYELVREGRLHSVAFGRKRLIPRVELEAFVSRELAGEGEGRREK